MELNIEEEVTLNDIKIDNYNNDEKILNKVLHNQKLSIIIDNESSNSINNENDKEDFNNIQSNSHKEKDFQKGFQLASSLSLDSFENLVKNNSNSHNFISDSQESYMYNENNFVNKKSNLSKEHNGTIMKSNSLSLELRDNVDSRNELTTSEYNSNEQVQIAPLKTKRPSLNFIRHITGFSELTGKSKLKNKTSPTPKDEPSANRKSSSVKKVIIRSDSNIIGHFDNVIVKEKKSKTYSESSNENDIKKNKNSEDNPAHTRSFQGWNNSRHNVVSTVIVSESDMCSGLSKTYSKSVPTTMNYHCANPVMNPENVDIVDHNYGSVKSTNNNNSNNNSNNSNNNTNINNLFIPESPSNGNINYNDFLFDDEQENLEQSNNIENNPDTAISPGKEVRKKSKINNKNVKFEESESVIPNVYEIHITEESELFCNNCKKKVHIEVKREYSKTFWILFIILLICGVIFAWIPFLFSRFKYYSFYCKICKKRILKLQQADE